jgi:lipopolysaccharide export system permease protein
VIRAVLIIAAVAAVLVACLSLYIRPWAWDQFFHLKTEAKANFDLTRMKGGTFYELWHGRRVIFAAEVDRSRNLAKQVFIYTDRGDARQVISAREARQFDDEKTGRPILMLFDGNQYEYSVNGIKEFMVEFQQSAMVIEPSDTIMEEKVKAAFTASLINSDKPEDKAELQWRLVTPVSTILLALLAVPLSRSGPRQGKFAAAPVAIAVFAIYYNMAALMKKWVAQGILGWLPGIWWSQIFLLVLFFIFMRRSSLFSSSS